jgi:hypothetical protein
MNISFICKKKGYGEFPYIIMQGVELGVYIQIPIHFLKKEEKVDYINKPGTYIHNVDEATLSLSKEEQIALLHDNLISLTKLIKTKVANDRNFPFPFWLCLVAAKKKAYYFEEDTIKFSKRIPTMGKLLTQELEVIAWKHPHYWDSK